MDLKELVRYRASLVMNRTRIRNKIHSILLMKGIDIKTKPFTREFIQGLKAFRDYHIDGYLSVLDTLKEQINDASRRIKEVTENEEETKLLKIVYWVLKEMRPYHG